MIEDLLFLYFYNLLRYSNSDSNAVGSTVHRLYCIALVVDADARLGNTILVHQGIGNSVYTLLSQASIDSGITCALIGITAEAYSCIGMYFQEVRNLRR